MNEPDAPDEYVDDYVVDYGDEMCIICLNNDLTDVEKCMTQCNHIMCKGCLDQVLDKGLICPMCRSDITSYACDGIQNRLLYKEKKRVRHIQTIIENRYATSKLVKAFVSVLLSTNILVGFFLIQCKTTQ
jgi:hypothetical protein